MIEASDRDSRTLDFMDYENGIVVYEDRWSSKWVEYLRYENCHQQ